jgi:hypothetical protein
MSENNYMESKNEGKKTKKEKNREAAIECRKKRKEYVHSLEKTIK